jgi:PAS domain S-box-containing protein
MHNGDGAAMAVGTNSVLDALAGLVWTARTDGRCYFVNRGWRDYTGLGLDEARDHGWQTVIHPDDRPSFLIALEAIRQAGAVDDIDARLRRYDGEYRWFALRPAPFPADAGSDPAWCWLAIDIDEGPSTDGRMRRLLDRLPIQVAFLNLAGTSEYSNRKTLEDYGMTLDELVDWQNSSAIHPDDHAIVREQLERLMTTGAMFDAQLRMHYKDGSYRWMRCLCVPFRDAQDNVVRYVTCQLDINDLKLAESLLAAEVGLLEMIARGDTLSGVLEALSRHVEDLCEGCFCSILRITPDNKHFYVVAGPSMPAAYNEKLNGLLIDPSYGPCSLAIVSKSTILTVDPINDPRWNGSEWPPLVTSHGYDSCWSMPIMSVSGETSGIFAIYRNEAVAPTTEEQTLIDRFAKIAAIAIDRAIADQQLLSRESDLSRTLVQLAEGQRLSLTGSFTADLQRDEHSWSDEYYRIFEIDPATRPSVQAVRDRIHPDDLDLFDAEIQSQSDGDFVFRVVTPSAGLKYLRGVAKVIDHVDGRPISMGTVQDITASKRAEAALGQAQSELAHVARAAALSALTASIAHEVSQPLSGILTNANTGLRMLSADPPNVTGAAETAKRTIRDADRATEVIKRLRAMFARKAPAIELIDLNEVARELIALSSNELQRSRVVIQSDFASDLPLVRGDRVQLQQVVLNLLLNAADAMSGIEDRPRTLLIKTLLDERDDVKLLVRDSGIGIDPLTAAKLFDPFYTTKATGMGVGLSISRSIIENLEGRLWAISNDGPGATFGFSIPRADREAGVMVR